MSSEAQESDARKVFVVHGRNAKASDGMFDFLRAIGLHPIDWSEAVKLTGKGSPYIGEILDAAFAAARAIVVLITPDEVARLRPEFADANDPSDLEPGPQARPNVLFEAGMGLGRDPDRTILVELGKVRPFSDTAGRHAVRMDGSEGRRRELAGRLETAGCVIDLSSDAWMTAGDLMPPPPPELDSQEWPRALEEPEVSQESIHIDAHYEDRGRGSGRLVLTNESSIDLFDLRFQLPPEAGNSFTVAAELPIPRLPAGKSVRFVAMRAMGNGADYFEIPITARTANDDRVTAQAFVSLVG